VESKCRQYVFECHEMINEKDAFTLEQFPDGLASLALDVGDLG